MAMAAQQKFGPLSLSIPNSWTCQVAQENFICLDDSTKAQRNSAIVVNYKPKSAKDSLAVYKDHLSRPRPLKQDEVSFLSQPKGTKEMIINGQTWVEGIHLGSEIPDYYTHYYATSTENYAILISFSAHHSTYNTVMPLLSQTVQSFRLSPDFVIPGTNPGANQSVEREFGKNSVSKNRIQVMGYSIKKVHLILVVAGILVLGLLGYAIVSD